MTSKKNLGQRIETLTTQGGVKHRRREPEWDGSSLAAENSRQKVSALPFLRKERKAKINKERNTNEMTTEERWARRIYAAYPRHVGMGGPRGALEAIKRAIKREGNAPNELLEVTEAFAEVWKDAKAPNHPEHKFIPHPATWFNQERYNDDPKEWRPKRRTGIEAAPINVRNKRINELNERKRQLIRAGAPYWKIHEIDMQLKKL